MKQIPGISWQPYDNRTIVAVQPVNFTTDTQWSIPTFGQYSSRVTNAQGVIIDNLQNNGVVTVTAGPLSETISPFSKGYLQLADNISAINIAGTVGTVNIVLFVGTYPGTLNAQNYAGAAALSGQNAFVGGQSTGSGNAQILAVVAPSGFQLGNGVLVTFTVGATNSGAVTLNVAGTGALPVHRILVGSGSLPLTGGELETGANVTVSYNQFSGVFEIVGDITTPFNGGTITTPLQIIDASSSDSPILLVRKTGTTPFPSFDTPLLMLESADAANDQVVMRLTNSATIFDIGLNSASNMLLRTNVTGVQQTAQVWYNDGSVTIGLAVGGNKGAGTLNIAGGLYIAGNPAYPARAWGQFNNAGGFLAGANIGSCNKVGTGQFEVSLSIPFASANYAVGGSFTSSTPGHTNQTSAARFYPISAGLMGVDIFNSATGSFLDPAAFSIFAFG